VCYDLDPAHGKTARVEYAVTGGGTQVDQWLYSRNVSFEGQSATEAAVTSSFSFATTSQVWTLRTYTRPGGATDLLNFGWTIDSTTTTGGVVNGTLQERLVYTPAALDTHASMAVGETRTFGPYPYTKTSTVNGVVQPVQNSSVSSTWRFVGVERITVPAGSFDTCRWETGSPTATRYELVGHGLLVRQVVPNIQTYEAVSLTVNGVTP
jgi:hypothetical protein